MQVAAERKKRAQILESEGNIINVMNFYANSFLVMKSLKQEKNVVLLKYGFIVFNLAL